MGAVSIHAGNGRACRSLTARGGGFHRIETDTRIPGPNRPGLLHVLHGPYFFCPSCVSALPAGAPPIFIEHIGHIICPFMGPPIIICIIC
jgi:hypothetical protein